MPQVCLEKVSKSYGRERALSDFGLTVDEGEVVVLLGPSGCGKTTTLRLLAGFERPDAGTITVGEHTFAAPGLFVPAERRGMSVVFQNYALWPHMTVRDNVGFGPWLRRRQPGTDVEGRVAEALDMVQLRDLSKRYPHQLSGGQQQRVALARALAVNPKVLLLDEPLSNLDTRLREEMRVEIKRLQRELGVTMLYVTHDQAEALALADRVVVLNRGLIEQVGTPRELYERPLTKFVAGALGDTNLLPAMVVRQESETAEIEFLGGHRATAVLPGGEPIVAGREVTVSLRPNHLSLSTTPDTAGAAGIVDELLFFGDATHYLVRCPGSSEPLKVTSHGPGDVAVGDQVRLVIAPMAPTVLAADSSASTGPTRILGNKTPLDSHEQVTIRR